MTGLRRVEHHLGTAITVALADPPCADTLVLVSDFFSCIAEHEAVLSRFRPDSELSRLADGSLARDDVSAAVGVVLAECESVRSFTAGDFDHEPRRRSGDPGQPVLDVDAFAKGWIVEQACLGLRMGGVRSFFVNAGGDIVAGSSPRGRDAWHVGIRDPDDATSVRATLQLADAALATSAGYERGEHIRGSGGRRLASVSVVGPDLAVADALATAVFASGSVVPSWWRHDGDYAVVALEAGGRIRWTSNADRFGMTYTSAA